MLITDTKPEERDVREGESVRITCLRPECGKKFRRERRKKSVARGAEASDE